jgi:hypothetical protein
MNVTALAYGLTQRHFPEDGVWLAHLKKSATRLQAMAR